MARMVQCPKCRAILQEPPNNPFYRCGSCFTVLQAKHAVGKAENLPQPNITRTRENQAGVAAPRPNIRQENLPPNQNKNSFKKNVISQVNDMRKQFAEDLKDSRKSITMPTERALRKSLPSATRNPQGIIRHSTDEKMKSFQLSQDRLYLGKSTVDSSLDFESSNSQRRDAGSYQNEISNKTILLRQQMVFKNMRRTLTSEDEDTEIEEAVYRRQKSMPGKLSDNDSPSLERTKTFHGSDDVKNYEEDDASSQGDGRMSRMDSVELRDQDNDSGLFRRQKTLPSRMSTKHQDEVDTEDEEEEDDEEDLRIYRRMKTLPSLMPDSNNDEPSMSVPPRLLNFLDRKSSLSKQNQSNPLSSKSKNFSQNGGVVLPERLKALLNKSTVSASVQGSQSIYNRSKNMNSSVFNSEQLLNRRTVNENTNLKLEQSKSKPYATARKVKEESKGNSVSVVENALRGKNGNGFRSITKPPKLDLPWTDVNQEDDYQSEVEDSPLRNVLGNKFSTSKTQLHIESTVNAKAEASARESAKEGEEKKEENREEVKPSSSNDPESSSLAEGQNGKKDNETEESKPVEEKEEGRHDRETLKENQNENGEKTEKSTVDDDNVLPELTRSLSLRTRKLLIGLESVEADVKVHNKSMLKSKSFISRHKQNEEEEGQHEDEENEEDEIDQEKEDKMFKKSKTLPNTNKNESNEIQDNSIGRNGTAPPLSQIQVNSNLPMLPPPDSPQVVRCQHCYQMLAVPPNLPPQKKPIQKLRCGKCRKVSSFSVPAPQTNASESNLTVSIPAQTKENMQQQSESQTNGSNYDPVHSDTSQLMDNEQEVRRKARMVQFQTPGKGMGDKFPRNFSDGNAVQTSNLGGRRASPEDAAKMNGRRNGGMKDQSMNVTVNGKEISGRILERAEKLSGPIESGDYWYDKWAGFWGVMGGPCLGIIPSFIPEFDGEMYRGCANGKTGIEINGRELHRRDLEVLMPRGLSSQPGRCYSIDISGNVIDEATGTRLRGLGKLAPTLEERKCGRGMFNP